VFTSILCPIDFSPHAERALGYAIDLARLSGAHLTIVHVLDGLLAAASEASGTRDTLLAQTQQEMQELLARIAGGSHHTSERIGIALVVGEPPEEILKQANECAADLIVMGTQGLEGTERLVFGSTTEHVLRESHVPVLAVPPATD
jgi:nucleotide-binding universal stress UspA family protein